MPVRILRIHCVSAACMLWGVGIISHIVQAYLITRYVGVAVLLLLLLYVILSVGDDMFGKKKKALSQEIGKNEIQPIDGQVIRRGDGSSEQERGGSMARRETVIGHEATFTGSITDGGNVDVYGRFVGEIQLQQGKVHIMTSGSLEGDIRAVDIVIDGRVDGRVEGQNISVLEHGELRGVCCSANFSIYPGGCFIGTSEPWPVDIRVEKEHDNASTSISDDALMVVGLEEDNALSAR